jgi:hypothetical protein
MAAGAPLIPEGALGIAAIADLLIALLDLLLLGVLLALLWGYKHTLGAVIQFLVDHTRIHLLGHSVSLLFPLELANNNIQSQMSTAALGLEVAGGRFFHAFGVIVGWMVNLALYSATTTAHAVEWLKHIHIPKAATWAALIANPPALLARLIRAAIAKELPRVHRQAKAVAHDATTVIYRPVKAFGRRLTKTEKALAGLAAAIAALGGHVIHPGHTLSLPKSWYGLTKRLARLERRMHRAEGWAAAGVLAAAMANVLGVSARCLRSGNVGKVARRLCGLSPRALEDLLGLIADALILANICQVITLLQEGLSFIEPEVTAFVTALETWACYGDTEKPPKLAPVALYRPAVTGVSLYLPQ